MQGNIGEFGLEWAAMIRTSFLVAALFLAAASARAPRQPHTTRPSPGESQLAPAPPTRELPAPVSAAPGDKDEGDLDLCVRETNRYRRKLGLPQLRRSPELEACAAEGARSDHASGSPHGHFVSTSGCGIAFAENEIPRWPLDYAGSVTETIKKGIADMWAEGPGGGHYENMRGQYSELGCGIYVDGSSVTVVQDYR